MDTYIISHELIHWRFFFFFCKSSNVFPRYQRCSKVAISALVQSSTSSESIESRWHVFLPLIPFPWIFVMNFKNDLLQKICRVDPLDNIASNKDNVYDVSENKHFMYKTYESLMTRAYQKFRYFLTVFFRIGKSMLVGNEEFFFFFNSSFSLSLSFVFVSFTFFMSR